MAPGRAPGKGSHAADSAPGQGLETLPYEEPYWGDPAGGVAGEGDGAQEGLQLLTVFALLAVLFFYLT